MWLKIQNPGVVDYRSLNLLGVSGTRYAETEGVIGMFGSGIKNAIALFLRKEIRPTVYSGLQRMDYFTKPQFVKDRQYDQVCCKFSGNGLLNRTDDLGFTTQWGEADWNKLVMAFREVVSNSIDGAILSGNSIKDVEFEVVDKPRAKRDHTSIFLPYTTEVESCYKNLNQMFLHFAHPELLKETFIPKVGGTFDEGKVLIYKNGVLVNHTKGNSLYNYNLGKELKLDESRNANTWDVQFSIAQRMRDAKASELSKIFKAISENPLLWEATLPASYLKTDSYEEKEIRERRKKVFQQAWKGTFGENSCASSGITALDGMIERKGFVPISVPAGFLEVFESYEIQSQSTILDKNEKDGKMILEPTEAAIASLNKIWRFIEKMGLTNGKEKPTINSFISLMDAGSQCDGYYIMGGNEVFIHKDLGAGVMLDKVVLEEVVHFLTQSGDCSRDIQDYLFRLIGEIINGSGTKNT